MNLFELVFKQMRQRALSTWLTLLSVLLGVGLATSIMILRRGSAELFVQGDFGYEMIVGAPQVSPLDLVLNTSYHMGNSNGTLPYELFDDMARKKPVKSRPFFAQDVKIAVPFMVGDSYNGRRIVGTSPQMFGADDDGSPLAGYDGHGKLVSGFEDPDVREEDRDKTKPVAAATFEYRKGRKYYLAEGRSFRVKRFEAVLGSDTAATLGMHVYDEKHDEAWNEKNKAVFQATHGFPGPNEKPDIHKPKWHVVGILETTHTANDRVLFVPIVSLYAIEEHEKGMIQQALIRAKIDPSTVTPTELPAVLRKLGFDPEKIPASALKDLKLKPQNASSASHPAAAAGGGGDLMHDVAPAAPAAADDQDEDAYHLDDKGEIVPDLPQEEWQINAILIRTRAGNAANDLFYVMRVGHPEAAAVNPASVMREFFQTFFGTTTMVLLIISALVTAVAAISILVSIYNSVSARMREIAILRALGATRGRILAMICCEAGMVGLIGGLAGLLTGHLGGAVESYFFNQRYGQTIAWFDIGWNEPWYANEPLYLAFVVVLAVFAGLVPAMKAYRSPVATNLVAG